MALPKMAADPPSLAPGTSPAADPRFFAVGEAIAEGVAAGLDLHPLAEAICVAVQQAFGAGAASLLALDGEALEFVGVTGPSASQLLRGRLPMAGEGVAVRVVRSGEPALLNEKNPDLDWVGEANLARGFSVHALIACPLFLDGVPRGAIEVLNPGSAGRFTQADLATLNRLAPLIATALAQSLLLRELRQTQQSLSRRNAMLERRVAESTLLLANAKQDWEATFDAIADPLAIIEDGIVRRTNLAYGRAVQSDVRLLPGLACHQARFGTDVPCAGCPVAKGGGGPAEAEIHHADGIFVRRAFRLEPGPQNAWVVSYQDVTESRKLAARLQEAEHQSAICRLAAGAAHEINNPLSFLAASLRMLHHYVQELGEFACQTTRLVEVPLEAAPGDKLERFEEIQSQALALDLAHVLEDAEAVLREGEEGARRVGAIVQALEILGRQDQGQPEVFDLLALSEGALERARQSVSHPTSVRWLGQQRIRTSGSPILLEQALFEVFRNAAQATAAHGGVIDVSVETAAGMAAIEVTDHGPGISEEHGLRVVEPFFTTRAVGSGLGLGLTVAYGVARRHGGNLEIETGSGGTRVRLTLPMPPVAPAAPGAGGITHS